MATDGYSAIVKDDFRVLDEYLDEAFLGHERLSRADLRRGALAADLPATALARFDALPEGEYAQDEAAEALRTLEV